VRDPFFCLYPDISRYSLIYPRIPPVCHT
jgi:hypothetical protein